MHESNANEGLSVRVWSSGRDDRRTPLPRVLAQCPGPGQVPSRSQDERRITQLLWLQGTVAAFMLLLRWLSLGFVVARGQQSSTFGFGRTIGGAISDWPLTPNVEMEAWSHNITSAAGLEHGAYLNHFWSAGGKGSLGQYVADRQLIRYYIDGETTASLAFEPAMASGSGIGWEGPLYYAAGLNAKEPWGPDMSNDLIGHSAETGGGWHNRFKVPFARSIRCTVQLPSGIQMHGSPLPSNFSSKMFFIFRGVEGDPRPLTVGSLALPPIVPWSLRLRKFQTRVNHVQPQDFVTFANYSSTTDGADSGGALLFTVFVSFGANASLLVLLVLDATAVITPFGGALEGCFRAYTEKDGPMAQWPGLMLSTGTEDYYDSAYYFNHEARTFYEADAGLSHVTYGKHGGNLASMFRLHHNDPVYFRGRFELVWRDGATMVSSAGRKCVLKSSNATIGGEVVDLTVDSWLYTWEQPVAT